MASPGGPERRAVRRQRRAALKGRRVLALRRRRRLAPAAHELRRVSRLLPGGKAQGLALHVVLSGSARAPSGKTAVSENWAGVSPRITPTPCGTRLAWQARTMREDALRAIFACSGSLSALVFRVGAVGALLMSCGDSVDRRSCGAPLARQLARVVTRPAWVACSPTA
jgi:hypothetical protein